MFKFVRGLLLCGVLSGTSAFATITLETSSVALGANDKMTWNFLGADGTVTPGVLMGTTVNNRNVTATLTRSQGLAAQVGGSWGPASGTFATGDHLLWAYDNATTVNAGSGPVTTTFLAEKGIGASVQADSPGAFTASIALYNGSTLLGNVTESSDAAGDAIFIGALSSSTDITKAVFSLTSSTGDITDFAMDTLYFNQPVIAPEPAGLGVFSALFLAAFALVRRKSIANFARKQVLIPALCVAAVSCGLVSTADAQIPGVTGKTISIPVHNLPTTSTTSTASTSVIVAVSPIPTWTYAIGAHDGNTYSGTIMGKSPYNRGKTTTTIPTQLIPLIITITDSHGTFVYDPTVVDSSCVAGHTPVDIINNSPLFTNNTWVMNGVNVGNTQYIDANQRAQVWSLVANTPYHLMLSPSTLAARSLSFGTGGTSGAGANYSFSGFCSTLGVVNIDQMDAAIQALITGPLAGTVNPGTLPLFLTRNVVMAESGVSLTACCVLGYHSGLLAGSNLQVYSPFSIDTAGFFGGGYVSTLSHEIGEAVNDPTGNNPTPPWGAEGQVSGCQANFEDGDPLSPGFATPTNEWIVAQNGLTYHLQELVFYNWFFNGPSLGANGGYSNHSTFTGFAKSCPPGGTN